MTAEIVARSGAPKSAVDRPIGVFDSGVGGLTVLHELLLALPQEDYIYLGDTARFPYGSRAAPELEARVLTAADALVARGAKLLVVACNSATAVAMPSLSTRFDSVDVIGVVRPEAQEAVVSTRNGHVGLLATPATVASGAYESAVGAADPHITLHSVACPDLAPIIQAGRPFDEAMMQIVRTYCEPLKLANVDTVILGCTHYPIVRPLLQRILGPSVTLVSSGQAIARRVQCALAARALNKSVGEEGTYNFFCTGEPDAFRAIGTRFLQMPLGKIEQIDVDLTHHLVSHLV